MRGIAPCWRLQERNDAVGGLSIRRDDASIQVVSRRFPELCIRISTRGQRDTMRFLELSVDHGEVPLAFEALHLVDRHGYKPIRDGKIVVEGTKRISDPQEDVQRHDRITDMLKAFLKQKGLHARDAFLHPNRGTLDTVILIGR